MGEPSSCESDYWKGHIFYKRNSASIWENGGWKVLQQEGFNSACLDGGGSFYFTLLASNVLVSDMGVCVPPSCSEDEITWTVFPLLFKHFFEVGRENDLHFAVKYFKYEAPSFPELELNAGQAGLILILLILMLGSPRGDLGTWPLLLVLVVVAQEVIEYTRWNMYDWLRQNLLMFHWARPFGDCGWQGLLAFQVLRGVQRSQSATLQQLMRWCCARALQLLLLLVLWQLVNRSLSELTINIFSPGAWYKGWRECIGEATGPLLTFGEECRHMRRLQAELLHLLVSGPLICLASLVPALAPLGFLAAVWVPREVQAALILTSASICFSWQVVQTRRLKFSLAALLWRFTWPELAPSFWPLFLALWGPDAGVGISLAELALPAVPVILLVLEGYVEPHGKDFTVCDLCARWLGVVFLSCLAGLVQQKLWQLMAAAQEFWKSTEKVAE